MASRATARPSRAATPAAKPLALATRLLQMQQQQGNQATGHVLQRMIAVPLPPKIDWLLDQGEGKKLSHYAYGMPINPRGQTFEDAVLEFIYGLPTEAERTISMDQWKVVTGALARQDFELARLALEGWKTKINAAQQGQYLGHPNKPAIKPNEELKETIPQSQTSLATAIKFRDQLLAQMPTAKSHRKWVDSPWKDEFMIGALVLPNGEVLVSHSGRFTKEQKDCFNQTALTMGYTPVEKPDDLEDHARQHLKNALHGDSQYEIDDDKVVNKHGHPTDSGNPVGKCAAVGVLTPGAYQDPSLFQKKAGKDDLLHTLALSEVWFSTTAKQKVEIKDKQGKGHLFGGNQDVASCLTCHFQVRGLAQELLKFQQETFCTETLELIPDELQPLLAELQRIEADLQPFLQAPAENLTPAQELSTALANVKQSLNSYKLQYQAQLALAYTAHVDAGSNHNQLFETHHKPRHFPAVVVPDKPTDIPTEPKEPKQPAYPGAKVLEKATSSKAKNYRANMEKYEKDQKAYPALLETYKQEKGAYDAKMEKHQNGVRAVEMYKTMEQSQKYLPPSALYKQPTYTAVLVKAHRQLAESIARARSDLNTLQAMNALQPENGE